MELIDEILSASNLTQASKEVIRNKGAGGIDGMQVESLKDYLDNNRDSLVDSICNCQYTPQPIRGKKDFKK